LARLGWRTALKGLVGLAFGAVIWVAASSLYNRAIIAGAEAILRAFEHPAVTKLEPNGDYVTVNRTDFDPRSPHPGLPVIDLTFNWVLLTALFAIDERPFSDRNVRGFFLASLLMAVTHVLALATEIQSIYVLRLGPWSRAHYGDFARNFWGAANHGYRFVIMFAIAFGLWWAFRPSAEPEVRKSSRKASRRRARS
jgi:hypothetical protein